MASYRSFHGRGGLSLIELMIGTVLVIAGVLGVVVATSKSFRSAKSDQLHWVASSIATSKIQEIKLNPIQKILLTDRGITTGWFADSAANPATGCNCANVLWTQMTNIPVHNTVANANFPYSEIITVSGVDFTCKVCVNRVEGVGVWTPYCPPPAGTTPATAFQDDYRLVRVQISWRDSQGQISQTEAQTLVGMQL